MPAVKPYMVLVYIAAFFIVSAIIMATWNHAAPRLAASITPSYEVSQFRPISYPRDFRQKVWMSLWLVGHKGLDYMKKSCLNIRSALPCPKGIPFGVSHVQMTERRPEDVIQEYMCELKRTPSGDKLRDLACIIGTLMSQLGSLDLEGEQRASHVVETYARHVGHADKVKLMMRTIADLEDLIDRQLDALEQTSNIH